MEWILLIFILVLQIWSIGLYYKWEGYNKKKGENLAIKEDSSDINYEGEKGKNLATKEDIDEITKIIESVKNEISFENQRKHTFIEQRTNRFINILYLAEKIYMYGSLLYSYLNDKYADKKMSILIEEVNTTLLDLCHECRLASVTIEGDEKIFKRINTLRGSATNYAIFITGIAISASNHIKNWQELFKLANTESNNEIFLKSTKESIEQLNTVRTEYEENLSKEDRVLKQAIEEYSSLLKILYKQDFYLKFDFVGINENIRKEF